MAEAAALAVTAVTSVPVVAYCIVTVRVSAALNSLQWVCLDEACDLHQEIQMIYLLKGAGVVNYHFEGDAECSSHVMGHCEFPIVGLGPCYFDLDATY